MKIRYSFYTDRLVAVLLFLTTALSLHAQEEKDETLEWSSSRKINLSDFKVKSAGDQEAASYAEFSILYKAGAMDFLSKNLNKRISTLFIKSASWIDTTQNIEQSLRFQQSSFDLCEIYVRQFRKALHDNRKKIKSLKYVDALNEQYTMAFSKRRIEYDRDTKAATDNDAQQKWEAIIQQELAELSAYSKTESDN